MQKFLRCFKNHNMHYLLTLLLFIFFTLTANAQDYQSKAELEKEILGTWSREDSPGALLKFYRNGKLERYYKGELSSTSLYEITKTCDGETSKKGDYFLKELRGDDFVACAYIEHINANGKGLFTIMSAQRGQIIIYCKEKA